MITFPHLGYLGRLGNQMFQYAALVGISKKHGIDFSIGKTNLELYKCFNIPNKIKSYYNPDFVGAHNLGNEVTIKDNYTILILNNKDQWDNLLNTNFDNKFFNTNHDNKSIFGFFQNYNYFKNVENDLRKIFTFKSNYSKICKSYFNEIFSESKTIALHIRRTDYLESSVLNTLSLEYYENSLSQFDCSIPVLVFSDDIEWCESQNIFNSNRFIMMKSNNTYIDLCLMSLCNYHIVANSSYSWWGSWLAKSEKTICPKNWFSSDYLHLDSKELRLPHWISL
jgi:hypothetical protein